MKTILYPFAFIASWYFWLIGHICSKIMVIYDRETWFDLWWPPYQANMAYSSDIQDYVNAKGKLWPWGEIITYDD